MRLSNVANNGSAPQNAAKQSIRERARRDQAGTVGPFSGIIMSSNGISLGAVTPHRAFSAVGAIATAADLFPSSPSSHPLPYFFAQSFCAVNGFLRAHPCETRPKAQQ